MKLKLRGVFELQTYTVLWPVMARLKPVSLRLEGCSFKVITGAGKIKSGLKSFRMSERNRRRKRMRELKLTSKREIFSEHEITYLTCESDNITVCSMAPDTAHSKIKFDCQ